MKEYYILLAVLSILWLKLLPKFLSGVFPEKEDYNLPYHSKYILTGPEYKFYQFLKPILDNKSYIICPKVCLRDLFEPTVKGKDRMKWLGKISQKHVDFLICDDKLRPIFAIELDDKSHRRPQAAEGDRFKNNIFRSASLPLYRVPTAAKYSEEYIKAYVLHLAKPAEEK